MLLEDARRLEKFDRLYSLRLDQLVPLPVLVVVGDQSSGKSSVLEALTGLPLPRDSTLCTRFPTQILFRRCKDERVDVLVIPADEPDAERKARLQNFASAYTRTGSSLSHDELLQILSSASEVMGLSGNESITKSFSDDLLKIEISGPDQDHFSIVDLPGIFRKPTPGITTKEDISMVRKIITSHIANERSIILEVVPANVDIATQEIFQMAEDVDPYRKRTLAVLTKPDLVDKGAEPPIIELVNTDNAGLGYTVVCNRSQSELEIPLHLRHTNEIDFFKRPPWNELPESRTGVTALKQRLNDLAVNAARLSFENVATEITRRLRDTHAELSTLGGERGSPESQRLYLLQIASEFQSLATKAIDGYYGRDECFTKKRTLRLAALIMAESEKFSREMYKSGSRRAFAQEDESKSDSDENVQDEPISDDDAASQEDKITPQSSLLDMQLLDLETMNPPIIVDEPVKKWIAGLYRDFKGFEIGSSNPSLITALVFEQTGTWPFYAQRHVTNVICCIHQCIHDLLDHVCQDSRVKNRVWDMIKNHLIKTYRKALQHVKFLVRIERDGFPLTLNHYFASTIAKRRRARLEKRLRAMKSWESNDDDRHPLVRFEDVVHAYVSNEQHSIEELEDVLRSYHKVARKRFVDNVCKQAIDHHLICSAEGPLHVFSAEFVGKLESEALNLLAGEDQNLVDRRRKLEADIDTLTQAMKIVNEP